MLGLDTRIRRYTSLAYVFLLAHYGTDRAETPCKHAFKLKSWDKAYSQKEIRSNAAIGMIQFKAEEELPRDMATDENGRAAARLNTAPDPFGNLKVEAGWLFGEPDARAVGDKTNGAKMQ